MEIEKSELDRLNDCWSSSQAIDFYKELNLAKNLPSRFQSLEEFSLLFPVTEKLQFQSGFQCSHNHYHGVKATSGSTGTPCKFPYWRSENRVAKKDLLLGRSWSGISSNDKMLLVWGHSHLLGRGIRKLINASVRSIKDFFLGYKRISAYDLSDQNLDKIIAELKSGNFKTVIGYFSALDAVARRVNKQGANISVKNVIGTAESPPFNDSLDVIKMAFNSCVIKEYGTVETGPIAYTSAENDYYQAFWWNNYLEVDASGCLLVTCLYPRATPLFRYKVGDIVEGAIFDSSRITGFKNIIGRSNLSIILPSGRRLHSESISHVFKSSVNVDRFQLWIFSDRIEVKYVAQMDLGEQQHTLTRMARIVDSEFAENMHFKRVTLTDLKQTQSGKFPLIIDNSQ